MNELGRGGGGVPLLSHHYAAVVCPSIRPSHFMGATVCATPSKSYDFQQIIKHVLQCIHDVDVHLPFCFDLDL